jgi:flagellar hook-associated protein 2
VSEGNSLNDVLAAIEAAFPGQVTAEYDDADDVVALTHDTEPLVLGSAGDTSSFFEAVRLVSDGSSSTVTSSGKLGVADVCAVINDAGANGARLRTPVVGGGGDQGSFTLNGATISYDTSTDSLADVVDRINDSRAGVVAFFDSSRDGIVLTSERPGALGIFAEDVSGNFVAALGLDGEATLGSNASIVFEKINGVEIPKKDQVPIVSVDNTFTPSEIGIEGLTLQAVSEGDTAQVTVGPDTQAMRSGIDTFLKAYNSSLGVLREHTEADTPDGGASGALQGDWLVRSLQTELTRITRAVVGGTEDMASLGRAGIGTTDTDPELSVTDESALNEYLENNIDGLTRLFADEAEGIAACLASSLEARLEATTGAIDRRESRLEDEGERTDVSIERLTERLERLEERYWRQFAAVESAVAQLQSGVAMMMTMLALPTDSGQE